jgi:GNAT superfamily N-acetyltransferase
MDPTVPELVLESGRPDVGNSTPVSTSAASTIQIRPYRDEDEREVLALLVASLGEGPGGHRSAEFFRWKHLENPFGRSFMLVCEADRRIVGLRAFLRWRFHVDGRTVRAVRPVDTATHPDYQGRGIFSRLTRAALDVLGEEADLVFNTPNQKSLPGYLKMGWQPVGRVPVAIRVRRPLSSIRGLRHSTPIRLHPTVAAPPAAEIIKEAAGLAGFLSVVECPTGLISTPRTPDYLLWRYGRAPLLDYRAVAEMGDGHVRGMAFFRVRPRRGLWEATVADVLVPAGDARTARSLLRRAALAATVDHLTCSFPVGSAAHRAAQRAGFLRAPRGIEMVVRSFRRELEPSPHDLRSWALRLGDLEVF